MIVKSFDVFKLKPENNFFLIYGKNEGLKIEIINNLLKNKKEKTIYEEKEIFDKSENFIEQILTKSLFETVTISFSLVSKFPPSWGVVSPTTSKLADAAAWVAELAAAVAELADAVADVAEAVAEFAAAVAEVAAALAEVVALAASTNKDHLALSVLEVSGCDPDDVWAVIQIKILLVEVSFTISLTW